MASTYSDLKFELIGTGEQSGTWGTTTNTNLGTAIEEAITGSADVTFASAEVTLTLTDTNASQTARNLRLNLTGTSGGAQNLIVPTIEKFYLVNNGCADAITVKNSTGTGIAVPAGKAMLLFNDATNVVDAVTHMSSVTLASALAVTSGGTGATDAATARSNLGLEIGVNVEAYDATILKDADIGSSVQAYDAGLTDIAGLAVTDGNFIVGDGANWVAESGATARTSLGLGDLATQSASSVTITGGSISGITDLAVADGGTGASSFTANSVLVGNGTSTFQEVAPGTSGNALISNGTSWTSGTISAGGGGLRLQLFTAPGTWTKPSSTNYVKSIVIGGGGGGSSPNTGGGLNPTQNGGTSSFGSFLSATGGQGGRRVPTSVPGTPGVGSFGAGGVNISLNDRSGFGNASNNLQTNATQTPGANPYDAPNSRAEPTGSGGQGAGTGGTGGQALKGNIPVPGPVAVTVGASGAAGPGSGTYAGVGGVVLVEWIQE
jgi:hypothetical protein